MYELNDSRFFTIGTQSIGISQSLLIFLIIVVGIILLILASFVFFNIRKRK